MQSEDEPVHDCFAPAVTVVISTLDRPERLARCLLALSTGSMLPAAVIVVDQGEPEATRRALECVRSRHLSIRHLVRTDRGLSLSQNAGVSEATTDVVAIVDDDCVPDERWVETIHRTFTAADGPLLMTGRVLPLPPEGSRVVAVSTRDSDLADEWRSPPDPWTVGTGGNFAVHRRAFLAVLGNDVRLGTGAPGQGGNDLDLFDRLIRSGARARYEPLLLVHHERSTIAEFTSRRSTYGFGVGAMLGMRLRRGEHTAWRTLGHWIRLRAAMAYRRRRERGLVNESRILAGTFAGLLHGARVG